VLRIPQYTLTPKIRHLKTQSPLEHPVPSTPLATTAPYFQEASSAGKRRARLQMKLHDDQLSKLKNPLGDGREAD
jgi:hypothetical protein